MAGEAYSYLRPTPLLSVAIDGAIDNAVDVTKGGALYNTSGTFNIGLADVVDSLMVIKKLVYEDEKITLKDLKKAVDSNFKNDPKLHAYEPFTPGATPHPSASKNFLDNIGDVAKLNPHYMDNNIAFNVKLVPSAQDPREKTVDTMYSYVKTYFEQGGMQIQFNMVNSDVLKDAMANPEKYQNLLVRISGYNAYFVNLNKEMQMELIERA
jgi:pyruvate-formate lyase